jgi:hypothetical protein
MRGVIKVPGHYPRGTGFPDSSGTIYPAGYPKKTPCEMETSPGVTDFPFRNAKALLMSLLTGPDYSCSRVWHKKARRSSKKGISTVPGWCSNDSYRRIIVGLNENVG